MGAKRLSFLAFPAWERQRYENNAVLDTKPSPLGKGEGYETRIPLFSHCQSEYTHMWKNNTDGQSLPRVGKVASGASRIGY